MHAGLIRTPRRNPEVIDKLDSYRFEHVTAGTLQEIKYEVEKILARLVFAATCSYGRVKVIAVASDHGQVVTVVPQDMRTFLALYDTFTHQVIDGLDEYEGFLGTWYLWRDSDGVVTHTSMKPKDDTVRE